MGPCHLGVFVVGLGSFPQVETPEKPGMAFPLVALPISGISTKPSMPLVSACDWLQSPCSWARTVYSASQARGCLSMGTIGVTTEEGCSHTTGLTPRIQDSTGSVTPTPPHAVIAQHRIPRYPCDRLNCHLLRCGSGFRFA